MMRRMSPSRFPRRPPPPRRGGRPRSLSPLSRSQPAPPGEERGRKSNPWDAQNQNSHKRPRTRSRSRERMLRGREGDRDGLRGRIERERELPVMSIMNDDLSRGRFDRGRENAREPPRAVLRKEDQRSRERSRERREERQREREREHEREFQPSRMAEKEKDKHHQKGHFREQVDVFEENYLDQHRSNFGNSSGLLNNHKEPILDPSSITFNTFKPENSRDVPRDIRHPANRPGHSDSFNKHEKEENAEDRINRLEKLVEKLVEGNVKSPTKKEHGYTQSKEVIPELIPSNSKYTTSMWINRIHEECLHRHFDEKSSIRFMRDKMTGIMKAWFKSVSNYDFTWPELKLLITKTFPDNVEFAQTLKLLVGRDKRADETITQYYFSKVYLCEACKITGENAVSCLIDGLSNPFLKQEIKSYDFLTPEALYSDFLCKFPEHDVPVRLEHREVRVEQRIETEFYNNEDFIPLEIEDRDSGHRMLQVSQHREERFANRLAERPVDKIPLDRQKCFTCKKFGHLAMDCRHAPICYNCKKKGHIAAKCPLSSVMLISSTRSSLKRGPIVVCKIDGQEFYGIVDTGAMTVTIKERLAKELKLKLVKSTEVLRGYGGALVPVVGEVEVALTADSTERLVKILVVDNKFQDDPLIIGQEFLFKEGVIVLIDNGNVQITDSGTIKGSSELI